MAWGRQNDATSMVDVEERLQPFVIDEDPEPVLAPVGPSARLELMMEFRGLNKATPAPATIV